MSEGEGHPDQLGFLWETQSWGLPNSDNSGEESKDKSSMNPPKAASSDDLQKQQTDEADATLDKKRSRRSTKKSSKDCKDGKADAESDDHEIHIWTERERRKKMRNMFAGLHALLPQLSSKADKSTIVDEAVNYIKTLQNTLQKLQKQKLERLQSVRNSQWHPYDSREAFIADQGSSSNLATAIASTSNPSSSLSVPRQPVGFQTWTSSNLVLNICGDEAQLSVCSTKKPGLFTTICFVLEKHKLEVLSAHISSDGNRSIYMIQAHANRASDHQFAEALSVDETFRQAAAEIMLWLS